MRIEETGTGREKNEDDSIIIIADTMSVKDDVLSLIDDFTPDDGFQVQLWRDTSCDVTLLAL